MLPYSSRMVCPKALLIMVSRFLQIALQTASGVILTGCNSADDYKPVGRWEATDQVKLYEKNDLPLTGAFVFEKGEMCAISDKTVIRKDLGYAKVSCQKGSGWVISGSFKKIND
jgi:hypothetical protein